MPEPPLLPRFPIGLGLAALGRPSYINLGHGDDVGHHPDRDQLGTRAADVLDVAWDRGVRYFDTARSYGMAEEYLGQWLARNRTHPDLVVVGSKWGYTYTAAWRQAATVHEVKDHSVEVFHRQLGETRINLGDHLDLYQIHSATVASGVLTNDAVLGALWGLKARGVAVGLTTSGPQQGAAIEQALEVQRDDELLFATVQATWNLLETSAAAALADASDAGMELIVKEAVANGRLTSREPTIPPEALQGHSPDAVAIAAALQQPWAAIVLSGAATPSQLRSNLEALQVPEDVVGELPDLALPAEEYWSARSQLAWT